MSVSIDSKIVELKFKNSDFITGARTSMRVLDALKAALRFTSGTDGFDKIGKAAKRVDLSGIQNGVQAISDRFGTMGIIGMTVLQNLTNSAMNFGRKVVSSVINPLVKGGITRALNIQQAQFQLEGLLGKLDDGWNGFKEDINYGVQDTAYGFDEAARVASQLAASGYRAGDSMKAYLRGISGVASMTGSSYSNIGDIFTTVAGNGRLMGEQLLQFSSRGLNASAALVKYFKEVRGESNITERDIRDLVSKGKIDFDTFAKAMDYAFGEHAADANKTFTGSLSNVKAALARIGADVASVQLNNLRDIFNALRPVIDGVHVVLGPLISRINELSQAGTKKLVSFINGIATPIKALDINGKAATQYIGSLTGSFGALTGMAKVTKVPLKDIEDLFKTIASSGKLSSDVVDKFSKLGINVMKPLVTYFKEVRGESDMTVSKMRDLISKGTIDFNTFAEAMSHSFGGNASRNMMNLQYTMQGLSAAFDIFRRAVTGIIGIFFPAVKSAASLGEVFLAITGALGRMTIRVDNAVKSSRSLGAIYAALKAIVSSLAGAFMQLTDGLANVISRLGLVSDTGNKIQASFNPIGKMTEGLSSIFEHLANVVKGVSKAVSAIFDQFGKAFSHIDNIISRSVSGGGMNGLLTLLSSGLLLKAVQNVGLIADNFKDIFNFSVHIDELASTLDEMKKVLVSYQNEINSRSLLNIAKGILMLSVALFLLSSLDLKGTVIGIASLAAMMGILVGALKLIVIVSKDLNIRDVIKIRLFAGVLTTLASSLLVLAVAVRILATMSWGEMIRGLTSLAIMLVILVKAIDKLASYRRNMGKIGRGLIQIAIGLMLLVVPLKILAGIKFEDLAKALIALEVIFKELEAFASKMGKFKIGVAGQIQRIAIAVLIFAGSLKLLSTINAKQMVIALSGMGGVLTEIALFAKLIKPGDLVRLKAASIGMIILAAALNVMAKAMMQLAGLSWNGVAKGLIGIAGILSSVSIAFNTLPRGMILKAAAIVIIANALTTLAGAMTIMSGMSFTGLAKGIGGFAVSIALIGVALKSFPYKALAIAPALIPITIAIQSLAASIAFLGSMSIEKLCTGIAAFAGSLGILALGLMAMQHTLAGALALSLAAAGISALGNALYKIGKLSLKGVVAALIGIAGGFAIIGAAAALLPIGPILALAAAMFVFGASAAMFGLGVNMAAAGIASLSVCITSGVISIQSLIKNFPEAITQLIKGIVRGIGTFLSELARNFASVSESIMAMVESLLESILQHMPRIMDLGVQILVAFLLGIAKNMAQITVLAAQIVVEFVNGLASQLPAIVNAAFNFIISFINAMAGAIETNTPTLLLAITNLAFALPRGLVAAIPLFYNKGREMLGAIGSALIAGAGTVANNAAAVGRRALDGIKNYVEGFYNAGRDAISGFINGMASKMSHLLSKAGELGSAALDKLKRTLKIKSPSREFMAVGRFAVMGFANAFTKYSNIATDSVGAFGEAVVRKAKSMSETIQDNIDNDLNPTITPVIDSTMVRDAMDNINDMFGNRSINISSNSAKLANSLQGFMSDRTASIKDSGDTRVINFNQVNNSPKALSRLEIYRQTKNQLSAMKGLLKEND